MPFTIVQLTDPHLGARWSTTAAASLEAAVTAVGDVLEEAPDAVVVTGDIASTPTDEEYREAAAILDRLEAPLYVIPGNHDDAAGLRRHFPPPGPSWNYAVELGPVRLIALDTTREERDDGELDPARLEWLQTTLAGDESTPTLLAMHHPPLVTGMPAMDEIGIPQAHRLALEAILRPHCQVQVIACGHVHRTVVGRLGAATVMAIPSTDLQLSLELAPAELEFVREPPGFAIHLLAEGRIVSHLQPFRGPCP